ncbi:RNA polymerase sigma-54 factor [Enterococcus haemoperoxidus ATCC BAA-382]|uniref:RNA polymerase sigma-54 factor n=1 Tax=Enterococcus haemoperoxidus ATCC BAA-382 TaxID=1158608 RepID=R2SIT3_9ENTE|nr:RNA polymerase factor sigma-54 [Enterococcus haemoperoxidus]EOH92781.1 RNA polymerase sigma-54 factor [Enterococcus haemoperoxidus ATCC BAA-382]EOT61524.1 RNA polymerase sigma-54 factor [Enterococcus haemoperoxidus ATCC BAA-382]OJG55357.1 RNA polymerase sigma-54 factor [Enterococcus haemoperoxidus]
MKFEQHQSQQQKQVQKLAMTQQLQQSIQILQYNSEELYAYIEAKSLENPLIDIQTETNYGDFPSSNSRTYTNEENNYLNQIPDNHMSLFEYLIDQIHLNYRDTYLRTLVLFLVEYIDLNGYLMIDLEEASLKTGAKAIEMLDALTLIQQLDPAGVGASDLRECLLLQVERDDTAPDLAYIVIEEEFDHLANRKWGLIAKKFDVELSEIQTIFDYIQTLTPAPGSMFESTSGLYIRPDLTLRIKENQLKVLSNKTGTPTIQFQQAYFERMEATDDKEVQEYIKEKKNEFEWLEKTIIQRGDTILKVGTEIVQRQQQFFFKEDRPLKPMTLKEIAESLKIHESTVSRAVNGKYLETEFGVFELRSFFSHGLSNETTGEETSTSSIKKQLQALVDNENKAKPLSDQKLVDLLKKQEIEISRRTVTKYREALGIPASSKRKRYDD